MVFLENNFILTGLLKAMSLLWEIANFKKWTILDEILLLSKFIDAGVRLLIIAQASVNWENEKYRQKSHFVVS